MIYSPNNSVHIIRITQNNPYHFFRYIWHGVISNSSEISLFTGLLGIAPELAPVKFFQGLTQPS